MPVSRRPHCEPAPETSTTKAESVTSEGWNRMAKMSARLGAGRIQELRQGQNDLREELCKGQADLREELCSGLADLRGESRGLKTYLRDILRRMSIFNDTLVAIQADYRDIYDRVRGLELKTESNGQCDL